jgi:ankyrin repeat protein
MVAAQELTWLKTWQARRTQIARERLLVIFRHYHNDDSDDDSFLKRMHHLWRIRRIVRQCPGVLTALNLNERDENGGPTLLHEAFNYGVPASIIRRILLHYGPQAAQAAQMADVFGFLPLHSACENSETSAETLSLLIGAYPAAMVKVNNEGRTPLHVACEELNHSPKVILFLLDRCPREVIGLPDNRGWTPLHIVCYFGCPCYSDLYVDIVRQMIRMYPKALRMLTEDGESPLHIACGAYSSVAIIKLLTRQFPVMLLVFDKRRTRRLQRGIPYDKAGGRCKFLQEATKEAIVALLACPNSPTITFPSAVLSVLATLADKRRAIPAFLAVMGDIQRAIHDKGYSMNYLDNNQELQDVEMHILISSLYDSDLQEMLQDEDYQDLICIMARMVKAGARSSTDDVESEPKDHVSVLESVSDTIDCIYLHLWSNPFLCRRSPGASQ